MMGVETSMRLCAAAICAALIGCSSAPDPSARGESASATDFGDLPIETRVRPQAHVDLDFGPPAPPPPLAAPAWPDPGGPPLPYDRLVQRLVVKKGERRMYAMIGDEAIKAYRIALGFAPRGHKAFAGDGRTPEGRYWIDRKNAYSQFHLSLGISYPNRDDRRRARALGVSPGGDIMIHGFPDDDPTGYGSGHPKIDWTWGCVAVTNAEIEELWRAVPVGTPIDIEP